MKITGSRCNKCGEFVSDIDAGCSQAVQCMKHGGCGGTWVVDTINQEDQATDTVSNADWQDMMHAINRGDSN